MSDTPRTDAEFVYAEVTPRRHEKVVHADFARQLERELAAAVIRAEKAEETRNRLALQVQAKGISLDLLRYEEAKAKHERDALAARVAELERDAQNAQVIWRPIETAPMDGTYVLLATPKGRMADGCFGNYRVWAWPYVMVNPTHWMPLPPRPVLDAARTGDKT